MAKTVTSAKAGAMKICCLGTGLAGMTVAFFGFLFLIFDHPLFAQDVKEYTVGVENIDYAPYYSVNNKGEYIGFAREVLDLFAKYNKIKFIYEVRSIKKLDQEFIDERRFDFKFPDNKFWKNENKKGFELYYSSPVCNFIDGIIVREEDKDKDINFFKTLGIGVVKGYSILGFENLNVPISETTNIQTLIENLRYNKINGAYFNVSVALNRINHQSGIKEKFSFNKKLPYYKSSFYLSSFNYPDIIHDFDNFLNEKRDVINDLKLKYGIID